MEIKKCYIIGENKPEKVRCYLYLTLIDQYTAYEGLTTPGYTSGARTFKTLERAKDYNNRLSPYENMTVYEYDPCCNTVKDVKDVNVNGI